MQRAACARSPHAPAKRGRRLALLLALPLALLAGAAPAQAPGGAPGDDPTRVLEAVVSVHARVPASARTADALGTEREGSGVVIDGNGLVLTIGYLILEAASAEVVARDGEHVPAEILAYDYSSGFGLLRTLQPLDVHPMPIGSADALSEGDPVLVTSGGGARGARPAIVVDLREFSGYWEYLLERAIFTAPPHPRFGGAALVGPDGSLLGIGSLFVGDAVRGEERTVPGNMFVPIDELKPILGDLLAYGRSSAKGRPWLGVFTEEVRDRLFVTRVSEEGPAAAAGIRPGDIILGVAGEPVDSQADFYRKTWALGEPGVEVPLTVLKGRDLVELTVESGDRYRWLRLTPGL